MQGDSEEKGGNYLAGCAVGFVTGGIGLTVATALFIAALYRLFGIGVDAAAYFYVIGGILPIIGGFLWAMSCCAFIAISWDKFNRAANFCLTGGGPFSLLMLWSLSLTRTQTDFVVIGACFGLSCLWAVWLLFRGFQLKRWLGN